MTAIRFEPNVPQVLRLKDPAQACLDGFNVLYETADGRTLALPRPAAIQLNMLDPGPDDEISITKYRQADYTPALWSFNLIPKKGNQ